MPSEILTAIIVSCVGSAGLFSFLQFLITRKDAKFVTKADLEPLYDGFRALTGDRLFVLLKDWKHSDVRTADEWALIENLYESYKANKGNHEIEKMYHECEQIPTTE